jgi:hypothetical protein
MTDNWNVIRAFVCLLCALLLLAAGCKRAPENKEAIRQAVTDHVTKNAGIDVSQINVEVGDVKFEGNQATAAVAFKPKGAPEQGMTMSYTLERQGEHWVVKGRGAGHGGGMGGAAEAVPGQGGAPRSGEMPAGHPPVNNPGGAATGELPAGHPPVNQPAPSK